jgi:hypothetical protein
MNSVAISLIVFVALFGGALLGMHLRTILPANQLSADSKGTMNVGLGLIGTMSALVLGLLVAAAADAYSTQKTELTQISGKFVLLDRLLAHYGPETSEARALMRARVAGLLDQMWPKNSINSPLPPSATGTEAVYDEIQELSPQNDVQRSIKGQALGVALDIANTRWLMFAQSSFQVQKTLLSVVAFWFAVVFAGFGLQGPRNLTVTLVFFFCALSVAVAILLILDLYNPYRGLIQVPSEPLRYAVEQLGK